MHTTKTCIDCEESTYVPVDAGNGKFRCWECARTRVIAGLPLKPANNVIELPRIRIEHMDGSVTIR